MSRLDDVGICLDKEEGKQSAKASVMSSSTVLRRASHTKNASQNSSDMSQSLPSESLGPPPDDDDSSVVSMSSQNSGRPMVPPPRLSAVHH